MSEIIQTARQKRYASNKEKEMTTSRKYYNDNKEKINTKMRCLCGGILTKNNSSNHNKTKRHNDFINNTGIFQYPLYCRKDEPEYFDGNYSTLTPFIK